ncbi:hypothetical protein [Hydrogenophaga sp. SL48]|uniref:hypothetical protein n=1 Tax=Hydrogenophaga sp. SL48 TaxID=2806347 RepID=UPI001F330723|nr:hypothetical protein [Hydrogenophaga sp. SL48]UJW81185.1 hypothetical protein IM738_00060 [Hydrogenophaga sp. SL48]
MKRLPLNQFAYPAPVLAGIGAKNTISSGPDDGANNGLAACFWQPLRHGSTSQAVSNSLSALIEVAGAASTGELNIGGHGNEGILETGMGQSGPFDVNTIIQSWNEYAWGPELDKINPSRITLVSIWSCHTGAGQDGADLLYAMARRCGRAVRAGTGFLYNNGQKLWWENGTVWQVATPTHKPDPISAPTPHLLMMGTPLEFEVGGKDYTVADIEEIAITLTLQKNAVATTTVIDGIAAKSAASSLFLPPALEMDAMVSGFITGKIHLLFTDKALLDFDVYNDRLAISPETKTAYYLSGSIKSLSRIVS